MTIIIGQDQPNDDDDRALSDNLLEQFAGFYVLSVLAVEWLQAARAHRAAIEADTARKATRSPA